MATKEYNAKYLSDPLNRKINCLQVKRNQQFKKGNIEQANAYDREIKLLQVEKIELEIARLTQQAATLRKEASQLC